MNISNNRYSKATRGLRQADVIRDQHFKLIFVYPVLVDNSLNKYADQIRDFISVSMLKEIFISNSLNMVSMASQIQPVDDENNQKLNVNSQLGNINYGGQTFQNQYQNRSTLSGSRFDIQRKVIEKTAIIRKLLTNDPKLSSLKPYIEMITLENLLDVPVIVGTKTNQVSSETLSMMLLVSAAQNMPLDNETNLNKITQILKSIKSDSLHSVLNYIIETQPKSSFERLRSWLLSNLKTAGKYLGINTGLRNTFNTAPGQAVRSNINRASQVVNRSVNSIKSTNQYFDTNPTIRPDDSFVILNTVQNNIDQTSIFFKFCLNEKLLKQQYGLDTSQGQMSTVIQRTSGSLDQLSNEMYSRFMRLIGMFTNPLITSITNSIYPIGQDIDTFSIKDKHINTNLSNNIKKVIDNDVLESIKAAIGSSKSPSQIEQRIKNLKHLCEKELRDMDSMVSSISSRIMEDGVLIQNPTDDEIEAKIGPFIEMISDLADESYTHSKRLEQALGIISNDIKNPLSSIKQTINDVLVSFINEYRRHHNQVTYGFTTRSNIPLAHVIDPSKVDTIINGYIKSVGGYMYFLFLYALQIALCKYVDVLEIEVETASSDVLDFPNYTLVVPMETLMFIGAGVAAKTWRELLNKMSRYDKDQGSSSNMKFIKDVNQNYIKGIIKYLNKRLNIPNLIVIDEKTDTMYYKLMHTSDINKMKLSTLNSFVTLLTRDELSGNMPSSYY